jgi:hypothetical protein
LTVYTQPLECEHAPPLAVYSLDEATSRAYVGRYIGPTGPEVAKLEKERLEIEEIEAVAAG